MEKVKLYKIIAISMITINILLIGIFFVTKPDHPRGKGVIKHVKTQLDLDDVQFEKFQNLAKKHHQSIMEIQKNQSKVLEPYFNALVKENKNSKNLDYYLELERKKIENTYNHFSEIQKLLNDQQSLNFEDFMNKSMPRILGKRNN